MTHPVDTHVGQRIRQRRWQLGMTQTQLAQSVGIRFQQIQKYETGANRVSASRLWGIAEALDVPVSHFFDGLGACEAAEATAQAAPAGAAAQAQAIAKEARDLVRSYYAIPTGQRRRLFDLARHLSSAA